jgi:hypothetical protein
MNTPTQHDILQPLRAPMLELIGRAVPFAASINGEYSVCVDLHGWSRRAGLETQHTTVDEVSFIELAHLADTAAEILSRSEATPG